MEKRKIKITARIRKDATEFTVTDLQTKAIVIVTAQVCSVFEALWDTEAVESVKINITRDALLLFLPRRYPFLLSKAGLLTKTLQYIKEDAADAFSNFKNLKNASAPLSVSLLDFISLSIIHNRSDKEMYSWLINTFCEDSIRHDAELFERVISSYRVLVPV